MSTRKTERAARLLETGLQRHQAGDIAQARHLYEQALAIEPRHPDALHLLGVVALQSGNPAAAVELLEKAVSVQPRAPAYHSNLACAYLGLKRGEDALASFRRAAALEPRDPDLQVAIGNCLAILGRFAEAESEFRKVAQTHPGNALAWFNLASAVRDQGRLDEARDLFLKAIELAPRMAEAHNNLGIVLHCLNDLEGAERAFRTCAALDPGFVPALTGLAIVLMELRRAAEGEALCREALSRKPGDQVALSLLGKALAAQDRWGEALKFHQDAVAANPESAEAYGYLGSALGALGNTEEALQVLEHALSIGTTSSYIHYVRALILFAAGRITEGAADYRYRDARKALGHRHPEVVFAEELPHELAGAEVCLLGEQGLGDEIFFLRYAPLVKARGARLTCCVDAKIASIIARHPAFSRVVTHSDGVPPADYVALVGDLPMALGRTESSFYKNSRRVHPETGRTMARTDRVFYPELPASLELAPLAERVDAIRESLARLGPPPYLGLTWRAGTSPQEQRGHVWLLFKEVPLEGFAAVLRDVEGTLVSLQRRPRAGETEKLAALIGRKVHDLSTANEDLEEMLALLALIDDYVGVSNTNMHLRAGVGKTARVLVPCPAEWRWMARGSESPWFPGFSIYRQEVNGDWSAALQQLAQDLLMKFGCSATRR